MAREKFYEPGFPFIPTIRFVARDVFALGVAQGIYPCVYIRAHSTFSRSKEVRKMAAGLWGVKDMTVFMDSDISKKRFHYSLEIFEKYLERRVALFLITLADYTYCSST